LGELHENRESRAARQMLIQALVQFQIEQIQRQKNFRQFGAKNI
jgi:hypothetical protein